jgi:nucleoporin GLE1
MGSSPPRRRSQHWSSPQRSVFSEYLFEDRNSESRHKFLIEAAKKEHDRVRAEAERVYHEHLQKEERKRLLEQKKKEEERIKREETLAAERRQLIALQAKQVEVPKLPHPQPAQPTSATEPPAPVKTPTAATPTEPEPTSQTAAQVNGKTTPKPTPSSLFGGAKSLFGSQPAVSSPLAPKSTTPAATLVPAAASLSVSDKAATSPATTSSPAGAQNKINGVAPSAQTQQPVTQPSAQPAQPDQYLLIHKNLKGLRKFMLEQVKTNSALKSRMGDMRREIRKTVGQLTGGEQNKPQVWITWNEKLQRLL